MTLFDLFVEYKTVLGGIFIGCATITGVSLNIAFSRRLQRQTERENYASFSSALASELTDNADNLIDLYFQISHPSSKSSRITGYKQFNTLAYEELLQEIGRLGPVLSFMVVDVYGEILKHKALFQAMSNDEIIENRDELLPDIQVLLVKAITSSIVMYLYADYMSGHKWLYAIRPQRFLWVEKTLDTFFHYVGKTDCDLEFILQEDDQDVPFLKRFKAPEKRKRIKHFFAALETVFDQFHRVDSWQAQIILRGLSYETHNMLTEFLDLSPDEYYVLSEKSYAEIIHNITK